MYKNTHGQLLLESQFLSSLNLLILWFALHNAIWKFWLYLTEFFIWTLFGLAKEKNPLNCNLSTIEADLGNYDNRLTFKTLLSIGQASPTSFAPLCPTQYKELTFHKICLFTIFMWRIPLVILASRYKVGTSPNDKLWLK